MRWVSPVLVCAACAAIASVGTAAHAGAVYSGTTSAVFSDPVLAGHDIAVNGGEDQYNNAATAAYTGFGTNAITWGSNAPNVSLPSSSLTFAGKTISNVAAGQSFDLGSITYTNGSSAAASLIFGATMSISITGLPSVVPASSALSMVATQNCNCNAYHDADFIGFAQFPQTFNVFEGATASLELYGKIQTVGTRQVLAISIGPDQTTNGFVGQGQGSPVPEPGGWAMLGVGLLGLGALRRRTQRG